jgi:hypothetical protein
MKIKSLIILIFSSKENKYQNVIISLPCLHMKVNILQYSVICEVTKYLFQHRDYFEREKKTVSQIKSQS